MGPIEIVFFSIGLMVALIGLARGYAQELGSTLIILVAIFILTFFQEQFNSVFNTLGEQILGLQDQQARDLLLSTIYSLIFGIIVFGSYAGRTLTFAGKPAPPPQGTIFSIAIGILNGYLIAGTLWYYQHAYSYPIGQIVTFNNELTSTAQAFVRYLPPALFENPVYWIVPVAILLIIRVRG